jgi:hypothetical protein
MQLNIDAVELKALVREVATELERERATLDHGPEWLACNESKAADLLGVKPSVLRDERARGNLSCCFIAGGRVRYTRAQLVEYLGRRTEGRRR